MTEPSLVLYEDVSYDSDASTISCIESVSSNSENKEVESPYVPKPSDFLEMFRNDPMSSSNDRLDERLLQERDSPRFTTNEKIQLTNTNGSSKQSLITHHTGEAENNLNSERVPVSATNVSSSVVGEKVYLSDSKGSSNNIVIIHENGFHHDYSHDASDAANKQKRRSRGHLDDETILDSRHRSTAGKAPQRFEACAATDDNKERRQKQEEERLEAIRKAKKLKEKKRSELKRFRSNESLKLFKNNKQKHGEENLKSGSPDKQVVSEIKEQVSKSGRTVKTREFFQALPASEDNKMKRSQYA